MQWRGSESVQISSVKLCLNKLGNFCLEPSINFPFFISNCVVFFLTDWFIYSCRKCNKKMKRGKIDEGFRIAFRMKTELEITDDGYKWRKYGKKMVKNNPNPR